MTSQGLFLFNCGSAFSFPGFFSPFSFPVLYNTEAKGFVAFFLKGFFSLLLFLFSMGNYAPLLTVVSKCLPVVH